MTTVIFNEPELVIALNKKIIFVNPNDLQIFKEVLIPDDLTKCGLKITVRAEEQFDCDAADKQQQQQQQQEQHQQQQQQQQQLLQQQQQDLQQQHHSKKPLQKEPTIIQHVRLSFNRQLLAVTTAGQKALLLYQCRPEHAKLISVRPLARISSALTFMRGGEMLLVTDKSGDCYEFSCVDFEASPRLLLGHLSVVYDVLVTQDSQYIITCDRDDKIRVTNYPATFDIHGYCLGHTEFVSGLFYLEEQVIASISGDSTIRLWNFESGQQLAKLDLPAPALRFILRRIGVAKYQAAVVLYQSDECVALCEIVKNGVDEWHINETTILNFPSIICVNLCFAYERLYVIGIEHGNLKIIVWPLSESTQAPNNWTQMIEEQFSQELWKPEDYSAWFKKRYDNVSEYLERKRRRIEEKQK